MPSRTRREYLSASAVALGVGLAGCTGGPDETASPSDSPTSTPSSTATPTATATESPTSTPSALADLTGAWPQPRADAGTSHFAPRATGPTSEPSTAWSVDLGSMPVGLAVTENRVFVATKAGLVVLDAATGQRQWSIETAYRVRGPAIRDGVAHLGVGEFTQGLTVADGSEVYAGLEMQFETVAGDTLFGFGPDGALLAYDAEDQSERWTFGRGESLRGPAVAGGRVHLRVGEKEELVALDTEDGSVLWRVGPPGAHPAALTATTDGFYQGSFYGTLYAHEKTDGTVAWEAGPYDGVFGSVAAGPETIYPVNYNGGSRLIALDRGDGTERWRLERPTISAPAVTAETVFVAGGEHLQDGPTSLAAIDVVDGSMQWALSPDDWVPHTPIVVDDVCFVTDIGSKTIRALV